MGVVDLAPNFPRPSHRLWRATLENLIPKFVQSRSTYAAGATLNITGNGSLNMSGNSQQHLADLIVADLQVTSNGGAFDVSGNALTPNGVDYHFVNY